MKKNYRKHRAARGAFERPRAMSVHPTKGGTPPRLIADATPTDIILNDGRRPTVTLLMDTVSRAVVGWQIS